MGSFKRWTILKYFDDFLTSFKHLESLQRWWITIRQTVRILRWFQRTWRMKT